MTTPTIFQYLPTEAPMIWKLAEAEKAMPKPKHPVVEGLKTVGSGLALMSLGTLAGYGAGTLATELGRAVMGKDIPAKALQVPASLAGAGLSYAYKRYKDEELEALKHVVQDYRNRPKRGIPSK